MKRNVLQHPSLHLLRVLLRGLSRPEPASWIVIAVGLNLAFAAFAAVAGLARPFVNLDFLLAALLFHKPFGGRIAAWALILFGIAYEIYRYVAGVYLFELGQLFDVFGYAAAWPLPIVIRYTSALCLAAAVLLLGGRLAARYRLSSSMLLAVLGMATLGAASGKASGISIGSTAPRKVAYSSAGDIGVLAVNFAHTGKQPGRPLPHPAAYRLALAERGQGDVLMVNVEALGVFRDPAVQRAFEAQIAEALGRPEGLSFTTEPYQGVTIDGELRALCGLGPGNVDRSIASGAGACLPRLFAQAGYRTVAVHAYDPTFYKRSQRYPALGFQEARFRRESDRRCAGAFDSGCDADALQRLLETPGERRFLYQMTIETHLPLKPCGAGDDPLDEYRCNHLLYFRSLGRALQALERPTRVVLVGDHAPPFPTAEVREEFAPGLVTVASFEAGPAS